MRYFSAVLAIVLPLISVGCRTQPEPSPAPRQVYRPFGETLRFLQKYTKVVRLSDGPRQVLVAPEFAGRVMASTLAGEEGLALGWIKREVVSGRLKSEQFVNYGGAERFWLAPEGGQYALYFKPGADFTLSEWFVPPVFNNSSFEVTDSSERSVTMKKDMELQNWSKTKFKLTVQRTVSLLSDQEVASALGVSIPDGVQFVAYKTHNVVTNRGEPITKDGGLVSIWILGMFPTEGDVLIIAPYRPDKLGGSGPKVKSDYFGEVPPDRLKVLDDPPVVLFKGDANYRSKIGLSPKRTTGVLGSIDWKRSLLTIAKTPVVKPDGLYVNNAWEPQENPFEGDAVNSYNDGPSGPKKEQFGYFYELETLSPTNELGTAESLVHDQITVHIAGPVEKLNAVAKAVLGADLTKLPRL